MTDPSWHLSRRSLLRGLGVACALPYLEAMEKSAKALSGDEPKRAAFVYFPNGCSLPEVDDEKYKHWRWFPEGEGEGFRFTKVLEPLQPFRDKVAVHGGLSHPKSRELLGHLAGDTWLTGGDLRGGHYQNNISVDQLAAQQLQKHTRYPSFVFSTDGGVGYKSRVSTLSFDANGRPIPSEHRHRQIFERYFAPSGGDTTDERRKSIQRGQKIVDLVLEESKRLERKLGNHDKRKLDEFLTSLIAVEAQVQRNEEWLDTPLKPFSAEHLELDPNPKVDPTAYVRTMYDLMVLGYQTDATRLMTYMLAREDGMGFGDNWPRLVAGVDRGHHTISHDTHEGHFDQWGPFDRWFAEQFAYFLGRMQETHDEWGPLLDNTMVLYGSCCSTTHNARNYPMLVAGGANLGVRHGYYTHHGKTAVVESQNDRLSGALIENSNRRIARDDINVGHLYVGMLQALGVEVEAFADAEGPLDGFFV